MAEHKSSLASAALEWYQAHARRLPWRGRKNAYAVWVAEIMLQQTRVETVIPYYEAWMRRFPTVGALAAASEQDVLRAWEGLGYYSRARNLHRAARIVAAEHGGRLPRDPSALRALPGIGRYTAGAIASIAFGLDEPALDGNLRRVYARLFDVAEPAGSPAGEKKLWSLAAAHVPRGRAGDFNQALMDLGALICLPRKPRCGACPLNRLCRARRCGSQEQRPVRTSKAAIPHQVRAAAVILRRGRVLLARRPSEGLLGGLWEFPNAQVYGDPARALAAALRTACRLRVRRGAELCVTRHAYTHFSVTVHAFLCEPSAVPSAENLKWVRLRDLGDYPMGKIDRQIARALTRTGEARENGRR